MQCLQMYDHLGCLTALPLALGQLDDICGAWPAGSAEVQNLAVVQCQVGLLVAVEDSERGLLA